MARPREFEYEDVLNRALQVFWTNGYKETSLEDLVTKLQINRASVYNTFGNKRRFYRATIDHYLKTQLPRLLKPLHSDEPVDECLSKFLAGMIGLGCKVNDYRGCFIINSLHELTRLEPELAEACLKTLQALEKELVQLIKKGQTRGEINKNLSAQALATLFLSAASGLMAMAKAKASVPSLKTAANTAVALVMGRS